MDSRPFRPVEQPLQHPLDARLALAQRGRLLLQRLALPLQPVARGFGGPRAGGHIVQPAADLRHFPLHLLHPLDDLLPRPAAEQLLDGEARFFLLPRDVHVGREALLHRLHRLRAQRGQFGAQFLLRLLHLRVRRFHLLAQVQHPLLLPPVQRLGLPHAAAHLHPQDHEQRAGGNRAPPGHGPAQLRQHEAESDRHRAEQADHQSRAGAPPRVLVARAELLQRRLLPFQLLASGLQRVP